MEIFIYNIFITVTLHLFAFRCLNTKAADYYVIFTKFSFVDGKGSNRLRQTV